MPKPSVYDELYPGRFLKAGLLKGKKVTLTIKDVDIEKLPDENGKDKTKAIVSFVESEMQLVLPKTNGICLKSMFGAKLVDWNGKKVTLFEDQWNGEPCIRIWGSPDIQQDTTVQIALPRRRPFPMVMHAVKVAAAKKPEPAGKSNQKAIDPRISSAWEAIGWTTTEGLQDLAVFDGEDDAYVAHLNSVIDKMNIADV